MVGGKAGRSDRARRFVAGMRQIDAYHRASITVLSKYFYSVSARSIRSPPDLAERPSSQISIIIFLWLQHGA